MKPRAKTRKLSEAALAKRMARAVARELDRLPQARYEAATVPYQNRSWLYEGVQDADYDMDPYTRTELLRVSRYFEKNDWACLRMSNVWNQYVFGPKGLMMVPSSEELGFNEAASPWWHGWCRRADYNGVSPLSVLQHISGRRWFFDGEIFINLVAKPEPAIQIIEGHRIQNPGTDLNTKTGNRIFDGIEYDEQTGRRAAYWVGERFAGGFVGGYQGSYMTSGLTGTQVANPLVAREMKYRRIPASNMIHLYEPERADQKRGISKLAPILRTVQDLHELHKLECLAARDAATTSLWITNATGQASSRGLRASQLRIGSQTAGGNLTNKPAPHYYRDAQGGEREYMQIGGDVKQIASARPSVQVQWYYEYLIRQMGTAISSSLLLLPYSLQATVARQEMQVAAGFFRSKSSVAIAAFTQVYEFAMGWAVRFDRSLDGAPSDALAVTALPPRSPDVDVGRNSAALIAEWEAGWHTMQDILAPMGKDWRHVMRQSGVELKFATELAKELGVPVTQLMLKAKQLMAEAAAQAPEEPAPAPAKQPAKAQLELAVL